MKKPESRWRLFIGAVVLLLLTGCSKVNKENYDQLSMGMEYDKVAALLGSPDNCSEAMGAKSCAWGDDKKGINVKFVADKAVYFSSKGLQ